MPPSSLPPGRGGLSGALLGGGAAGLAALPTPGGSRNSPREPSISDPEALRPLEAGPLAAGAISEKEVVK